MAITLTPAEQNQIAAQTWKDASVIMSFYEWLRRFKEQRMEEVAACRLALYKQRDTFQEVYAAKVAHYLRELRKNSAFRLQRWKRLRPSPRFMTKSGVRVRSKIEKIIADFLSRSKLGFLYEPCLKFSTHIVRPDFYLTEYALPYEHFGLGTLDYLRTAEIKIVTYHRAGVPFIYTTFNDEPDIEDAIVDKLAGATLDL